jgi:hypothetical protein
MKRERYLRIFYFLFNFHLSNRPKSAFGFLGGGESLEITARNLFVPLLRTDTPGK